MNSPAASSLALSLSPNTSGRVHIHDENLSFSDHSSRFSSPKGLRLALSPLSPLDGSMNSNSFITMGKRESSTEKRQIFSPTRRKRRGISSLTHASTSSISKKDDEYSSTKKTRLQGPIKATTPHVSSIVPRCDSIDQDDQTSKVLHSPQSIFEFDSNVIFFSQPEPGSFREAYLESLGPTFVFNIFSPPEIMTHQQELYASGCSLLSLEDVILPAIIGHQQSLLRTLQGKAQGYKDSCASLAFQYGRLALNECSLRAVEAIQKCRSDEKKEEEENQMKLQEVRRKEREAQRLERKLKKEQEERERETAKTLLLMQKQSEADKRRRERRRNFPRNKELWNEVALLMTELRRLEKEEKVWKDASDMLDKLESESLQRIQKIQSAPLMDDCEVSDASPPLIIHPIIDDCAVSASRIKNMTENIELLTAQSDSVRKTLYDSYNNHHKFSGYFGVKDPKALLRALALG